MWRKLHFLKWQNDIVLLSCMYSTSIISRQIKWISEFEKCISEESQRPEVPIVEETHVLLLSSLDLIHLSLPSVFSGSKHCLRKQVKTEEETWLAYREESDQRTQDRKVTLLTYSHNLEAGCDSCVDFWMLSLSLCWSLCRCSCGDGQCGSCRLHFSSPW